VRKERQRQEIADDVAHIAEVHRQSGHRESRPEHRQGQKRQTAGNSSSAGPTCHAPLRRGVGDRGGEDGQGQNQVRQARADRQPPGKTSGATVVLRRSGPFARKVSTASFKEAATKFQTSTPPNRKSAYGRTSARGANTKRKTVA
jgi:hypothetical protein